MLPLERRYAFSVARGITVIVFILRLLLLQPVLDFLKGGRSHDDLVRVQDVVHAQVRRANQQDVLQVGGRADQLRSLFAHNTQYLAVELVVAQERSHFSTLAGRRNVLDDDLASLVCQRQCLAERNALAGRAELELIVFVTAWAEYDTTTA